LAYTNSGKYDLAIADFTAQIKIGPAHAAQAYAGRAEARYARGDLDEALVDYTQALGANPRDPLLYSGRAAIYRATGEFSCAILDCSTALAIDPNCTSALMGHALALAARGDFDHAIAELCKVIELDPDNVGHFYDRGRAYHAKGNLDAATADYDASIRLDPNRADAYASRALAWHTRGDLVRANADLTAAIRLQENSAFLFYDRAFIKQQMQDVSGAISDYGQAIRLDPTMVHAYINRGVAWRSRGKLNRAIADYGAAISLSPRNAAAYHNRGNARAVKGEIDRAIVDFGEALRFDPANAETFANRGKAYCMQGDFKKAVADFNEAYRHDPATIATLRPLGIELFAKGQFAPAAALLRPNGSDKDPYLTLLRFLARARAGEDAIADLEADAGELRRQALNKIIQKPWPLPLIELFLRERAPEDTFNLIGAQPQARGEAHFYVAQWHLLRGNLATAKTHLRRARSRLARHTSEQFIARAELRRMSAWRAWGRRIRDGAKKILRARSTQGWLTLRRLPLSYYARARITKEDALVALAACDEAIRRHPDSLDGYVVRARTLHAEGLFEHAIADFDTAIAIAPRSASAYANRGHVWRDKGDFTRAFVDFAEAIRLDPHDTEAYTGRGLTYIAVGNRVRAMADFCQALELERAPNVLLRSIAMEFFAQGNFSDAAQLLRISEEDHDPYPMLYHFLACARARRNGSVVATAELAAHAEQVTNRAWPFPLIELFLRKCSPEEVRARVAGNPRALVEADFFIAQLYLAYGAPRAAKESLKDVVAQCPRTLPEYKIARAELKRLRWWRARATG
jgi:tetratricopeptide (TPR) repeat protein